MFTIQIVEGIDERVDAKVERDGRGIWTGSTTDINDGVVAGNALGGIDHAEAVESETIGQGNEIAAGRAVLKDRTDGGVVLAEDLRSVLKGNGIMDRNAVARQNLNLDKGAVFKIDHLGIKVTLVS